MKNTDRYQSRGGKIKSGHELRSANRMLILFLSMVLMFGGIPAQAAAAADTPSPWAAEEFVRALTLDFVPVNLRQDCRAPITRAEFAELAVLFLQSQYQVNPGAGYVGSAFVTDYCERHMDSDGSKLRPEDYADVEPDGITFDWYTALRFGEFFSDVSWQNESCNYAYAFGVVTGRGDGIFDPDGAITRQEAATMLARVYSCYAGEVEETDGLPPYTDAERIADWAQDSVQRLNLWGVMQGMETGAFDPEGSYTREQSIITFLRLYENAPISRAKGNIMPLVPYDDEVERQLAGGTWIYGDVWNEHFNEGETCAVMVQHHGKVTLGPPNPVVIAVYRAGGYRMIQIPLNGVVTGGYFSEDESAYSIETRHADGYIETITIDLVLGEKMPSEVRPSVPDPAGIVAESISVPDAVLAAAKDYVKQSYAYLCGSTGAHGMVDGEWAMLGTPAAYDNWRIEGLELVYSYCELDGRPLNEFGISGQSIDVYLLDFRIHTLTPGLVSIAGGADLDGEYWLLPGYPNSIYLYFSVTDGEPAHVFTMMSNDSLPGNELFTRDLINGLLLPEA